MIPVNHQMTLGKSGLRVPRMGIGAMVWGQPKGMARWTPAQLAYGPSHGTAEEEQALKVSLAAGVNLIDTAEMYSNGASERRVVELVQGKDVLIATKFPPSLFPKRMPFQRLWETASLVYNAVRLIYSNITFPQVGYPSQS